MVADRCLRGKGLTHDQHFKLLVARYTGQVFRPFRTDDAPAESYSPLGQANPTYLDKFSQL